MYKDLDSNPDAIIYCMLSDAYIEIKFPYLENDI